MTFEGKLHKTVEWDGKTEHNGMYLRIPNEPECDHFSAVLAIRPEDVDEYTTHCAALNDQIINLQHTLNQYKASVHHRLIPFKS